MKTLVRLSSLMLVILAAFGCDMEDRPASGQARVNLFLVDAPGDYDEVWVEVLAVRVKADYEGSEMTEDESSWEEIIFEGPQSINLLDLTAGNSLLLGSEEFPEGEIDQIRLVLGENNYLVKDGVEVELTTPSAQQSGLKIKVDQEIVAGNTYNLIIDFDVAKSIVEAGNSGNVILKPVLRGFLDQTEAIQGQVLPTEAAQVQVTVTGNGMEASTFTDENGNFSILGLQQGTYTVTITPNENYQEKIIENVVVVDGQNTIIPAVTLDPVAPPAEEGGEG